eukprot:TRINITY_DN11130_c0_g1_i1.p1 TRINITY_DN11130_c0_g1~~TRINITY_DN11130_c0_g1_i1.p1  ORF type:complete len:744 (+),score=137.93 TRINITY_DN11130_c0_g1_i1:79-2310(+)
MQFGEYSARSVLGTGEFSKVYLGVNGASEKYALKVLESRHFDEADKKEKFQQEIDVLSQSKHPNILGFVETIYDVNQVIIVLEYCPMGDILDFYLKYGMVPRTVYLFWMKQITSAIEYCHKHGYIHRDLKLENFLLGKGMHVKVADFGYVARINPEELEVRYLKACCGSPAYAAPELLAVQSKSPHLISTTASALIHELEPGTGYLGPPVDIWSLGVCFYAMIFGSLPFDHADPRHMFLAIKSAKYTFPKTSSFEDRQLISQMLLLDPKARLNILQIRDNELLSSVTEEMFLQHLVPFLKKNAPAIKRNKAEQKILEVLGSTIFSDSTTAASSQTPSPIIPHNDRSPSSQESLPFENLLSIVLDYAILDAREYSYIDKCPISCYILFRSIIHLLPPKDSIKNTPDQNNQEAGLNLLKQIINSFDVSKQLKSTSDDFVAGTLSMAVVLSNWTHRFYKDVISSGQGDYADQIRAFVEDIDNLLSDMFDTLLRPFSEQIGETLKQIIFMKQLETITGDMMMIMDAFEQFKDLLARHPTLDGLSALIWSDLFRSVDAAVFNSLLRGGGYSCGLGLKLKYAVIALEEWVSVHLSQRQKTGFSLLRELADTLTLPKETILSEKADQSHPHKVCPSLTTEQLHYILEHYKLDVYDEQGVPSYVQNEFRRLSSHDLTLPFWTELVVRPTLSFVNVVGEKVERPCEGLDLDLASTTPLNPIPLPICFQKESFSFLNIKNGCASVDDSSTPSP